MPNNSILKLLAFVFGLNFIWEISQMFLYEDHVTSFWNFMLVHIKASLGDVLIFLIIYVIGTLIFQNRKWFLKNYSAIYIFASAFGFAIAIIIEKYALATGRWQYNDLMPIIPFFKVGLSPVLQLVIIPFIIIMFAKNIFSKK